jgi:hypothetical protein
MKYKLGLVKEMGSETFSTCTVYWVEMMHLENGNNNDQSHRSSHKTKDEERQDTPDNSQDTTQKNEVYFSDQNVDIYGFTTLLKKKNKVKI